MLNPVTYYNILDEHADDNMPIFLNDINRLANTEAHWVIFIFLIGVDEDTLAFLFIRRVVIDQHLIGADITIQSVGGKLTAKCLDKSACKKIKEILMDYNKSSKSKVNIFS